MTSMPGNRKVIQRHVFHRQKDKFALTLLFLSTTVMIIAYAINFVFGTECVAYDFGIPIENRFKL